MRRSSRLAVALKRPEDVVPHLGKPTHWKDGRSAKLLAERWFGASDILPVVRALLDQAEDLVDAEFLDAWLERETDLRDGRGTPTQTDLLALLGLQRQLAVLGIEAKVDETFGPLVREWIGDADGGGKAERLKHLCGLLRVKPEDVGDLRYQLLHRTAAVILEAQRFRTDRAILIVQSFCPRRSGLADAALFYERIGMAGLQAGVLIGARRFGGVDLSVGWAADPVQPMVVESSEHRA